MAEDQPHRGHDALAETEHGMGPAEGNAATANADPLVGQTLRGIYRVDRRIGEGGMGAVYLAEHVHLGKAYAIKALPHEVSKNAQAIERLKQEAVAASSIDHENIVNVVSLEITDDGRVYIVMELLEGRSLAEVIQEGPLDEDRAIDIALQICTALQAAHDLHIIHRDLKPENIFLIDRGGREQVKVLDFGISKVKTADAEQVRVTKTGQLVGTPLYMSPEQARGENVIDHRADVYATGIILYEMVTGNTPFGGDNYFQILWKHGNENPTPVRDSAPNVGDDLARIIMRALEKSPEARFESMSSLADSLKSVQASSGAISPAHGLPVPNTSKQRVVVTVGLLAAVVAAGFFWSSSNGDSRDGRIAPENRIAAENRIAPNNNSVSTESSSPTPSDKAPTFPGESVAGAALIEGVDTQGDNRQEDEATPVEVQVTTVPPGAKVKVDGDDHAERTPVVLRFANSDQKVELILEKRGYRRKKLSFVPGAQSEISEKLRKNSRKPTANKRKPLKTDYD